MAATIEAVTMIHISVGEVATDVSSLTLSTVLDEGAMV
jgi:hypothetical protein